MLRCFYKPEWTDEVGEILVCRIHKNNSRHDVTEGFSKPCLTVDPYPEKLCKERGNENSNICVAEGCYNQSCLKREKDVNVRQELEELDSHLKAMIQQVREDWMRQQMTINPELSLYDVVPAEQAKSADGRPLLADLLVARANVLTTLASFKEST